MHMSRRIPRRRSSVCRSKAERTDQGVPYRSHILQNPIGVIPFSMTMSRCVPRDTMILDVEHTNNMLNHNVTWTA